jgi:sulfonate transport system permease protein
LADFPTTSVPDYDERGFVMPANTSAALFPVASQHAVPATHTDDLAAPVSAGPGEPGSARAAPPARKPGSWRGSRVVRRLVSPLLILAVWQAVSGFGIVSSQKLPPPTQVWHAAITLVTTNSPAYGTLQDAMLVSLQRVALGFAFGAGAGLILAVVAGLSRLGEDAVDPPMQMLRTLPLFGLIPVFIVWFGIGEMPKVLLIAMGAAIPLYLNTFAGVRGVDAKLAEAGQSLGLSRAEMIRHIVLPGALPQILVGLRQSLGVAWLALVVAEQVNANAGLGFIISQATQFLRNDVIFVALIVYCLLGLLTDALVRLLERKALVWRRGLLEA